MNHETQKRCGIADASELSIEGEEILCQTIRTLSIEEVLMVAGGPETDVGEGTI